jgi:hypothetical protein
VTANDGDGADTKFESKGAEANGDGDDLFDAEDLKSEVGAAFDEASCIVVCIRLVACYLVLVLIWCTCSSSSSPQMQISLLTRRLIA